MRVSDRLSKIMQEKNIRVHELARTSGVHHSGIYRILKEENKNPGIYTVKKLADSLGVKIDDLVK